MFQVGHEPERKAKARALLNTALTLAPDLGERIWPKALTSIESREIILRHLPRLQKHSRYTLLQRQITQPGAIGINQAELRLNWEWDELRGDPRFDELLAGPEPQTIY